MKIKIKTYDFLPETAKQIRNAVFVKEQGFIDEFDEIDCQAKHMVVFEKETPVATCRFFQDEKMKTYVLGRVAVMKKWRGKNIGALVLSEAENKIRQVGGTKVSLSSQVSVAEFYEKQGYVKRGEPYLDQHCPHIWMVKEL